MIDEKILELFEEMAETTYREDEVGLAPPKIGILKILV